MIDEAAMRGAEVTRHLLAFARKQTFRPRETDINPHLLNTVKLLRPSLGEQVEIKSMLEDDAWPTLVDPSHLTTALLNLAVNARDAMPNGGKLTLETGNVAIDESYANANGDVKPGPYVMVAVSDTGTGIPSAIRDKVFDPFFTTKGVGKGTGLGLSMVYGFVKQSGGHIKICSEEGYGTSFRLYLPRAGAGTEAPVDIAPAANVQRGSESILVVEDDVLVRRHVIAQIESLGYRTVAAGNAAEAMTVIDRDIACDLLFTDVILPGGTNGRELADAVRKRRPGMKVLFTSGYTESAIIHHGRLDPGGLLLAKPYRKSDLALMLRRAIDSAASLSAA
jgi:CheY-like chemotaxis protein